MEDANCELQPTVKPATFGKSLGLQNGNSTSCHNCNVVEYD